MVHGRVPVVAKREIAKNEGGLCVRHAHLKAQNTAPHSSADAIATMMSLPGTERRSSETLLGRGAADT